MVILKCIAEGSRLRMKIISNGYIRYANCQCPRDIRIANRYYKCSPADVSLVNTRGSYFYHIRKNGIQIIPETNDIDSLLVEDAREYADIYASAVFNEDDFRPILNDFVNTWHKDLNINRPMLDISALKVFNVDDSTECSICLSAPKALIYVPCGHYISCKDCNSRMKKRTCPICRQDIQLVTTPDQIK